MKYIVDLTIIGNIEVEAESKEEARKIIDDGYSLSQVNGESDEIDDIYPLEP